MRSSTPFLLTLIVSSLHHEVASSPKKNVRGKTSFPDKDVMVIAAAMEKSVKIQMFFVQRKWVPLLSLSLLFINFMYMTLAVRVIIFLFYSTLLEEKYEYILETRDLGREEIKERHAKYSKYSLHNWTKLQCYSFIQLKTQQMRRNKIIELN